jgi:hypothetical protein
VADEDAIDHRDALLATARRVVASAHRSDLPPDRIGERLHAAWHRIAGPPTTFDDDFCRDGRTGVEALAFVVGRGPGRCAGVILRLRGELPDSFEPVDDPPVTPSSPTAVRRAFFGSARLP